ncbi:MAG: LysR family transcriptional regulator [Methylocystaceae bacterium]|nr:LysR family transcriptional regulator [Methylocystaceae bacterium]
MKPMHHDLRTLRLFAFICHSGSVSKAATQLNMAVSAASRRLRLLEEEVGATLVLQPCVMLKRFCGSQMGWPPVCGSFKMVCAVVCAFQRLVRPLFIH